MNGELNSNCVIPTPALGIDVCSTFEKQPKGLIFTEADFSVPAGTADIGAYIRERALPYFLEGGGTSGITYGVVDVPVTVFPLLEGLTNLEPTGGDVRISQEGFGSGVVNGHENYQEVYTFIKGGICLFKQISKMEGRDMRVFFVDEGDKAYGVRNDDGTTQGFLANIGASYRKNVGTTPAALRVSLVYSNNYADEFKNITAFDVPADLKATKQITLKILDYDFSQTGVIIPFQVISMCTGKNITKQVSEMPEAFFVPENLLRRVKGDDGVFSLVQSTEVVYYAENSDPLYDDTPYFVAVFPALGTSIDLYTLLLHTDDTISTTSLREMGLSFGPTIYTLPQA
jgi:hypothetical protein